MKFKGLITDQLGNEPKHKTINYNSFFDAQLAAERLGKKHFPSLSFICIVGIPEPGDERREPAHV